MKLLCDQMLGSLTTWLRILGYDTMYAHQEVSDNELIAIAKTEQRVLISRDKELIQRTKKHEISSLEILSTNLDEQLHFVLKHLPMNTAHVLTRCTRCNTQLHPIEKNFVEQLVPTNIFKQHDTFWFCQSCKKAYWMGTHYRNMMQKIKTLQQKN